jgi:hypothetical protein
VVVLEGDGVAVVAPVVEVRAHLGIRRSILVFLFCGKRETHCPLTTPFDLNVVKDWVEFLGYPE